MPDATISITGPMATIVDAAARAYEATMNYAAKVRESESAAAKDMEDHIRFQAYWDFRAVLQVLGIVKDPMAWPPKP